MKPILIFNKNKAQAVLDRMVLHTQQDRAQILFISEICQACGSRRYCPLRKASKIFFYACFSFAASRVLKNAGLIDPPIGGNLIHFIPFRKAIKSKRGGNKFWNVVSTQKAKKGPLVSRERVPLILTPWVCRPNAYLVLSTVWLWRFSEMRERWS